MNQTKQAVSVELRDLVKVFPAYGTQGDFTAVNHVSLTAEPGEMVTLLGPSGCGKTTILRMVSGFEIPTSGKVLIGGRDVSALPPTKRNVSYDELKKTWMAKMNENCIFISAKNRDNYQEFRDLLYKEIRDMHAIRYPYDNFLY